MNRTTSKQVQKLPDFDVTLTHEQITELIPAFALDCLDDEETVAVTEHLPGCAACRAELESYQSTVDRLALAVPEVSPPPELQGRLMARVRPAAPVPPPAVPWWQKLAAQLRTTAPVWGAAALLVLLALGVSNLYLRQQLTDLQRPAMVDTMRTVSLRHTQPDSQATGIIIVSTDGEYGALIVEHLYPLPENQQYQLWLIDDNDTRISGAVFSVDDDGYRSVQIEEAPLPLEHYTRFGITVEPAGGSPGPTGQRVLAGSM
ncbi:MAG: hypothetical protein D6768_00560 [Chloroflexi bacterium]|nr:MAG: hypothetical protein D6768_00560 [Chloroflexota bacterium]